MMKIHNKNLCVLSLGGSLVVPDAIDTIFLKKFKKLILSEIARGKRFICIVGGGKIARRYQQAARQVTTMSNEDLDWLGIHATRLNAHLLRTIFRKVAYPKIITNTQKIKRTIHSPVIIASGFRPGASTDLCAVRLAKEYGATTILNLSNIDWVYSKDPKKYPNAKKFESMTWRQFRSLFGTRWDPGANVPFDPKASLFASRWGLRVVVANGKDLANVRSLIRGTKAKGTIIE